MTEEIVGVCSVEPEKREAPAGKIVIAETLHEKSAIVDVVVNLFVLDVLSNTVDRKGIVVAASPTILIV